MFGFFLVLAILSLILLVVGTVWWLAVAGRRPWRSGSDVGAELMDGGGGEVDGGVPVAETSIFVGKGIQALARWRFLIPRSNNSYGIANGVWRCPFFWR